MMVYPRYTPVSLGRELGIMFGFIGACLVTMAAYSFAWRGMFCSFFLSRRPFSFENSSRKTTVVDASISLLSRSNVFPYIHPIPTFILPNPNSYSTAWTDIPQHTNAALTTRISPTAERSSHAPAPVFSTAGVRIRAGSASAPPSRCPEAGEICTRRCSIGMPRP